jgi:hypothetical protein
VAAGWRCGRVRGNDRPCPEPGSGAAIAIGALAEGAGFATGTKAVVIIAFAVLFLGLLQAVRTLVASPAPRLAGASAKAAAVP